MCICIENTYICTCPRPSCLEMKKRHIEMIIFHFVFTPCTSSPPPKMLEKRHDLVHNRKLKKDCVSEANMGLRKVMLSEYSGT